MRPFVIAGTLVLLFAASVFGQTNVTAQRIGDFTYYSGTVDGKPLRGRSQKIGRFKYTDLRIGRESLRATSQRIGSTSYLSADEEW